MACYFYCANTELQKSIDTLEIRTCQVFFSYFYCANTELQKSIDTLEIRTCQVFKE